MSKPLRQCTPRILWRFEIRKEGRKEGKEGRKEGGLPSLRRQKKPKIALAERGPALCSPLTTGPIQVNRTSMEGDGGMKGAASEAGQEVRQSRARSCVMHG
jgi:hypothetical protein